MALTEATEVTLERPTCCAYAAGRVFYGMKNSLYYSQLIEGESIDFLHRCYSKNDPTAEQLSDILDTDGGVIQIDEAINIKQVSPYSNGVLVYAENGLWYIGGPETGFTATNFSRNLVSTAGISSPQSVITVEGDQFYWSPEGIYRVSTNQFGQVNAESIIEGTLQTFYNDIPLLAKERVSGVYNKISKQVEWFYASATTDYKHAHDISLVLDLRTGGLWPQSYNSILDEGQGQFIVGGISTKRSTETKEVAYLVIDTSLVTATQDYRVDFGFKDDRAFNDFNLSYPIAYIETGYESLDKPSNTKSAPMTGVHFLQTEESFIDDGSGGLVLDFQSSCKLSAKWDANSSNINGRWSAPQQAYRFRRTFVPDVAGPFLSGETIIATRMKVLGRGKILSLRFEQEVGKDMKILGYSTVYGMKGRM